MPTRADCWSGRRQCTAGGPADTPQKATHLQRWIAALYARKGYHKNVIAIASKHARILWAMLARDQHYYLNARQGIRGQPHRA